MATPEPSLSSRRHPITHTYARDSIQRQVRGVRAYVLPLNGQSGFRIIPVVRFSVGDNPGIDIALLNDVWSINGVVDERTIPVRSIAGRRQTRWEMYSISFLRPCNQDAPANPWIGLIDNTIPITGEFIIFRKNTDGSKFLNLRRIDQVMMEGALRRLANMLYTGDPLWRTGM